jgi:hypothetical protein
MRGVEGEFVNAAQRLTEPCRHVVEGRRQLVHFVTVAGAWERLMEIVQTEPLDRAAQLVQRRQHPAYPPPAEDEQRGHRCQKDFRGKLRGRVAMNVRDSTRGKFARLNDEFVVTERRDEHETAGDDDAETETDSADDRHAAGSFIT